MQLSVIRDNIKQSLFEDGIHRDDTFINLAINEGYKLVALLTLFDERRKSLNVDGSRNFNTLPTDSGAYCIAPLYVANSHTGARISPAALDEFEFYASAWEGQVDTSGNALYYMSMSQFHEALHTLVLCPIQNIGRTQITLIGAYIPVSMSSDTDDPRLPEEFQDVLFYYARFYAMVGEIGRADDALVEYKLFIQRLNALIVDIRARFPSGRDYEPWPVEFVYSNVTARQQEEEQPKETKE